MMEKMGILVADAGPPETYSAVYGERKVEPGYWSVGMDVEMVGVEWPGFPAGVSEPVVCLREREETIGACLWEVHPRHLRQLGWMTPRKRTKRERMRMKYKVKALVKDWSWEERNTLELLHESQLQKMA